MSVATHSKKRPRTSPAATLWLIAAVMVVVAGIAAMAVLNRPAAGGLARTGDVNDMGLPVVTTPGQATGEATAGGVTVSGAHWALGRVPLNVSVQPMWTLRNTGGRPVTLGEPHAEVRQGCCPGPLTLSTSTLAPGEEALLTFDLAMHEGMDGWHDLGVHVPVGDDAVVLSVTGDFRS